MTLRSATTAILFGASVFLTPAPLLGQITTFVSPPRKVNVDSAKAAVVAANPAHADSVARMSLTNMKAWVDSAAGVDTTTQVASADTAAATQPIPTPTPNARETTTSFANGAVAPNTASPLPALFVAGLFTFVAGLGALGLARRRG